MSGRLAIDIKGLTFTYPSNASSPESGAKGGPVSNSAPILSDLDWQVPEGAFALLCGSTGSGKSTLLRLLKPELAPVGDLAGTRMLFGRELGSWTQEESAAGIGYVAQDPGSQIVCDTVRHEIAFGLENLGCDQDTMRRRVADVSQYLGLTPLARRRTDDLSGGEQQAVTVASTLALLPRLLLLDEPTAQLDPVAEKNLLHELFRINRDLGITVVVATHEPEACAEYATCAFSLEDGRISSFDLEALKQRSDTGTPLSTRATLARSTSARPTLDTPASVVLDDVHFRYGRNESLVLAGVDLIVRRGSVHALIGGNGSGKTTLLRLVAGIHRPQRGRVCNECAHNQAFLPQDPKALFVCDTVDEELREWQRSACYTDAAVEKALVRTHLDAVRDLNPYDLSGGQQQALALTKLELTSPDLLLLDEPTKGLDPQARLLVGREITRLASEGSTVIIATHDLSFVSRVADTVTLLFDGEVAAMQPTRTFFADEPFLQPRHDRFCDLWDEKAWKRGADAR